MVVSKARVTAQISNKYFEAYLEEKFLGMSKEISGMKENQDKIGKNVDSLCMAIEKIRVTEAEHFFDCPNTLEIKLLKENMGKLMEIRANWKVYLIALCVLIVVCVSAGMVAIDQLKTSSSLNRTNINTLQNEMDNGKKVDSK